MSAVKIVRALVARRIAVGVVLGIAILAAVGLKIETATPPGGAAEALALVDTPSSQVVDLGGDSQLDANITTLSMRATLLAGLMTSSPLKEEIAVRAGVPPTSLLAVSPATTSTSAAGNSATPSPSTSSAGPTAKQPNYLTANVPDLATGQIPIITVDTQAPTTAVALRLANSSVAVLSAYLKQLAAADHVSASHSVVIRQLGPATATAPPHSTSTIVVLGGALAVLAMGIGVVFGIPALRASWQRAEALEAAARDGQPGARDGVPSPARVEDAGETATALPRLALRRRAALAPLDVGLEPDAR